MSNKKNNANRIYLVDREGNPEYIGIEIFAVAESLRALVYLKALEMSADERWEESGRKHFNAIAECFKPMCLREKDDNDNTKRDVAGRIVSE